MSKNENVCRTPRHRSVTRSSAMIAVDDSPTLSQEPPKVTWKWDNESTPLRPKSGSSKLKTDRWLKRSPANGICRAINAGSVNKPEHSAATSTATLSDSPKGLFKFEEEMRKLQCDNSETERCDNGDVDMQTSSTELDSIMLVDEPSILHVKNDKTPGVGVASTSCIHPPAISDRSVDSATSDPFKQDLLNDSDFDQMLLSCTEGVERKLTQERMAIATVPESPVSAPNTLVTQSRGQSQSQSQSSHYMSLFNDESIDDILGNFDESFIMHSVNAKNSKLSRHKSMPQELQPQQLQSSQTQPPDSSQLLRPTHPSQPQNATTVSTKRKSFTRHESMPVARNGTNGRPASSQSSK